MRSNTTRDTPNSGVRVLRIAHIAPQLGRELCLVRIVQGVCVCVWDAGLLAAFLLWMECNARLPCSRDLTHCAATTTPYAPPCLDAGFAYHASLVDGTQRACSLPLGLYAHSYGHALPTQWCHEREPLAALNILPAEIHPPLHRSSSHVHTSPWPADYYDHAVAQDSKIKTPCISVAFRRLADDGSGAGVDVVPLCGRGGTGRCRRRVWKSLSLDDAQAGVACT